MPMDLKGVSRFAGIGTLPNVKRLHLATEQCLGAEFTKGLN